MNKKNPYEAAAGFNPGDILDQLNGPQADGADRPEAGDGPGAGEEAAAECQNCKEANEARLRALAEVDNMRKRLAREKEESIKFAASNVLSEILPSLDNLDLALEHGKNQEACKDFFIGVEMTKKLLLDALKRYGLEPVGEVGEAFDPAIHEAVGMNADPNVENGGVCAILNKGYKLHERLLRPARVVVCKK